MVNIIKSINIFRVKYPLKWSYPKIWLHYDLNFAENTIFPNLDKTLSLNAGKFRKVIRSFSNENAGVMVHGGGRIILWNCHTYQANYLSKRQESDYYEPCWSFSRAFFRRHFLRVSQANDKWNSSERTDDLWGGVP